MRFRVFGDTASQGNLMAMTDVPENPENSGVPVQVLAESSETAQYRLRFFYPGSKEAPLCGHALLGAVQALQITDAEVETAAGIVQVRCNGEFAEVNLGERQSPAVDLNGFSACWLGLMPGNIHLEGVHSAGKAKLCIWVDSLQALNTAEFNLPALADWNQGREFSGYVLYTEHEGQLYARATNPLFNLPEDSACGVCCSALPLIIGDEGCSVLMGFPDYPNRICLHCEAGNIWVGGRVTPA
ncbi:PhzF family phenazine biosynthesis protein [Aliamphritea spongicola]|uniref:PhzF family phenazine biosynthesis protein n=1 Tax=Aliamphritea spongicola TaxID=707589 RepID=UPI00196B05B7|nr:PhzF family phenazine biosynthesis protein [Aliamphritea spongicola]MBN3561601.1 PhzF family phenazine biosynthesis protein [Aliamphritea spongicola]